MSRQAYDSDLSDTEWQKIAPLIPNAKPGGRPRSQKPHEIANAMFYMVKVGGPWRLLPHDLPKWQTVYYFRRWETDGTCVNSANHGLLRDFDTGGETLLNLLIEP